MIISEAKFVISNEKSENCPITELPEYAFIGRSNVGKSSLINMLTGSKKLAKTSSTPGKTQLINHFLINQSWYLVDLPGYGWARVSKAAREKWGKMISYYLRNRPNLACVFVLIDSRLEPQELDLDFIQLLGEMQVPFVLAFTKTDKQSGPKTDQHIKKFCDTLLDTWEELPQVFKTSSEIKIGRDEILNFIEEVNTNWHAHTS